MQYMAAAHRDAVDRGDHRLGNVPDQLVQVADLEHAAFGGAIVAGLRPLLDIAAGAERLLSLTGQDHRLDTLVRPSKPERLDQFFDCPTTEGVVAVRAVDR